MRGQGVVGPTCREGNTNILTHDLVHRTHLEIFEYYYPQAPAHRTRAPHTARAVVRPRGRRLCSEGRGLGPGARRPIFSDWWMDDWITHVYGVSRTRRGPFVVRHRIGHQGTRYEVDQTHEARLQTELQSGRRRVERWLLSEDLART